MYKVKHLDLSEKVYHTLKNMILNDELKSGEKLNQQKLAQELGVINNEERDTWTQEFYVPFYRVLDGESEARGPKMLDGLTGQSAYKRLKGAERQIGDPMSNVLQNWHQLIASGMKNKAAQETVKKGVEMGIMKEVSGDRQLTRDIRRYCKRTGEGQQETLDMVVDRIYQKRMNK